MWDCIVWENLGICDGGGLREKKVKFWEASLGYVDKCFDSYERLSLVSKWMNEWMNEWIELPKNLCLN